MDHPRNIGRNGTTRAERSTQHLRDAILTLQLVPGARLVERNLERLLGVSRTSIRSALLALEGEGLVTRGRRGVFSVAVVSPDEARQIYEVRAALEPAMVRLFIARASTGQFAALQAAVGRAEAAARDANPVAYVETFREFYGVLLAGSGNEVARSILETLAARVSYLRHLTTQRASRLRQLRTAALLRGVYTAVAARDPALAARRSAAFVVRSARFALEVLADGA